MQVKLPEIAGSSGPSVAAKLLNPVQPKPFIFILLK